MPYTLLHPGDFQQIVDQLHAVDAADRFLSHLLLEEGPNAAFERHVPVRCFDAHEPARHKGVARKGPVKSVGQRCVYGAHGGSNKFRGYRDRTLRRHGAVDAPVIVRCKPASLSEGRSKVAQTSWAGAHRGRIFLIFPGRAQGGTFAIRHTDEKPQFDIQAVLVTRQRRRFRPTR